MSRYGRPNKTTENILTTVVASSGSGSTVTAESLGCEIVLPVHVPTDIFTENIANFVVNWTDENNKPENVIGFTESGVFGTDTGTIIGVDQQQNALGMTPSLSSYVVSVRLDDSISNVVREFTLTVRRNAASKLNNPNISGPVEEVHATLRFQVVRRPSVNIILPSENPIKQQLVPIRLEWVFSDNTPAQVVEFDNTTDDMTSTIGTLSTPVRRAGTESHIYDANLMLPDDALGTGTITVFRDAGAVEHSNPEIRGPIENVSETFAYDTRGLDKSIPGTVTLCEETYTFANNPHFSGAFCNVLEMLVQSGYIYFVVQFVRDRGSTPTNFLAWDTRGASALFRVPIAGGSCQRLVSFDDVLSGARSLCVFEGEVHYFRGSHYLYQFADATRPESNADWRKQVGEIWKLENGTTPKLVGKTGRIEQKQTARPGDDAPHPYDGIRGGTVSPLVAADDELYHLTGRGDTRELGANLIANKAADDIRNWNLAKLTQTLETRIPVLETNGHPGWENVKQLAQLTRSRVGFRGEQFQFEPTAARTAKIKTAVTDAATSVPLKDFSRVSVPSAGTVLIQGELMTYAGIRSGTLTGVARGAYETTPDGYQVNDTVVFVDYIIDEYLSLSLSNDPSQIYNIVRIAYGDGQEYTVKDETSIADFGRRELSLTGLPLGAEQTAWAEHLAKGYLADFKDPKTVVSLTIEANYDIQIGDVVFVKQTERAHLFNAGQVVEVRQTLSGQQRNQAQTTRLKVVLI